MLMVYLVGRHPLRDALQLELTRRAVAYRGADSLQEFPFTVSTDDAGATKVTLGCGNDAATVGSADAVANFLEFPGLESEVFADTEQSAAWWAFLDAAGCRVWNGPSSMGFPAPAEALVFSELLREKRWKIAALEATVDALPVAAEFHHIALRDVATGAAAPNVNVSGMGVVRRTPFDPLSTRHLLWVAGRFTDMASPSDSIADVALLEDIETIAAVLTQHSVGAALLVVQQDESGTPELLAVQAVMHDSRRRKSSPRRRSPHF
jgi:hypothetical protein